MNNNDFNDILSDEEQIEHKKNNKRARRTNTKKVDNKRTNSRVKRQNIKSKSGPKNSTRPKVKNENLDLPWSCTLGLENISKLDSLETIYKLKNRDAALSLVINSPKTLKQLVRAKGSNAQKLFNANRQLFMAKHKDKAKAHYEKFYTAKRYER